MTNFHITKFACCVLALASISAQANAETDAYRELILAQHNYYRGNVMSIANMLQLTYSTELECAAKKSIEFHQTRNSGTPYDPTNVETKAIAIEHFMECGGSSGQTIGQNYNSGELQNLAVYDWVDKRNGKCSERDRCISNFNLMQPGVASRFVGINYAVRNCGGLNLLPTFANFSQVMWATTSHLGCVFQPGFGTLCFYSEAGNTLQAVGVPSFFPSAGPTVNPLGINGRACALCPAKYPKCVNRLCVADDYVPRTTTTTTTTTVKPTTTTTTVKPTTTTTTVKPTVKPTGRAFTCPNKTVKPKTTTTVKPTVKPTTTTTVKHTGRAFTCPTRVKPTAKPTAKPEKRYHKPTDGSC